MKKRFLLALSLVAIFVVILAISISAAEPVEVIDISKNNDGSVIASIYESEEHYNAYVGGLGYVERCYYEMIISGNGEMEDFEDSYSSYAWTDKCMEIISVKIESGVKNIGKYAFANWFSYLKEITIADGLTDLGGWAFMNCHNLTKVVVPNSVTSIGVAAFAFCGSLKSVTLPEGITEISDCLFDDGWSLTEINIPNSVTKIGGSAFDECTSLVSINIPKKVTSIGSYAFNGCKNLTRIKIPAGVTTVGEGAFSECVRLTIFCQAEDMPSGWNGKYNPNNRPVFWGCLSEESYLNKIFTFKGYSFDWTGSMAIGFDIDYESVAFYKKMTGLPFEMGVVFTGYETLMGKQPLDEKATPVELEGGKVLKANLCGLDYLHYDFMLTDIIESARDVELVIAAYLYDGNGIKYVQGNGLSDTVSGISYNRAKESGTK